VNSTEKDLANRVTDEGAFDPLGVIQRLEVGPAVLEPRRVTAPYRVIRRDGTTEQIDLIYRYEEDVFSPESTLSSNLASVITAQVAVNYGLFCDEIRFHGILDPMDQRFIEGMARNTAREIYVNKFLKPNFFLRGPAAHMPVIRKDNYLRARIVFDNEGSRGAQGGGGREGEGVRRDRYAVLSSGGKDSLLSYGLLNELGYEVHPLYVNESGRHWFTALNAYRDFAVRIPHTARVWTNSDRVFNWMLHHLPFIREDHARIRSDDYPVRLWTVAVFLFGVLPLLFRRGIGRLVVGDEYDTTTRVTFHGIPHYDGLYDQSRYFDEALTRYFQRKQWGISQFSILRPLSELLIQKILAERYPELHRLQVSCHAAHRDEERVRPCGRCEKCRRIVGMLLALEADPGVCGYDDDQVRFCMKSIQEKGIHQENRGAAHIGHLLRKRGLMEGRTMGTVIAREHPEILNMRFDPDRSPHEGIPVELREPLYRIWEQHASGASLRSGRSWIDVDPFSDESASRPYRFDKPQAPPSGRRNPTQRVAHPSWSLAQLTWPEAETRFREVDVALLPVGAIEQHGPHLPLDTDAFDAEYLAQAVAGACSDPKPLVLPLVPYGVSYHHEDFRGTIGIAPDTLSQIIYDIGMSSARHGITKLVIINGHGGNGPALHFAAQKINRDAHIFTCVDTGETSDPDVNALAETPNDVHAGEIETSTTLAVRPEQVRMDRIRRFVPEFSSRYLNFTSKRSVEWYAYTARLSATGVLGDPTKATSEKGEQMWALMIRHLVAFVEDLKRLSLDEIYQKRY